MGVTKLGGLVNRQVMADLVDAKLTDNIVFGAIADVDYSLQERDAGNTLVFPCYSYIGAASLVSEASAISITTLTASSVSVAVGKFGKAVEISDEAALSGYGSPLDVAAEQIALALDDCIDGQILNTLSGIGSTMTFYTTASTVAPAVTDIADALEKFGEDIGGVKVLYVTPSVYTAMRKAGVNGGFFPASEMAAEIQIKGSLGEYQGCNVVVTNRLKTSNDLYIVKPGAVKVILKRGSNIESERDILKKTTVIAGDIIGATYLYDASKAVRMTKKTS